MADTDKLLTCPFCGGPAENDLPYRNAVICTKCLARGPLGNSPGEAIAAWNRRTSNGEAVAGDDDDQTLAAACRKYNIGTVKRLHEIIADLRSKPSSTSTGEAVAWKQALGAARSFIANAPHDDHCFTNDPNPDACRCVCDKDSLLDFIDETMLASSRGDTEGIIEEIAAERRRQVESEGWTPEHDDEHTHEELARAAACYARPDDISWSDNFGRALDRDGNVRPMSWDETSRKWSYVLALRWPWARAWWKPTDRRRNLIKAGALIVAEIERLDRAALTAALRSTKP